MLAKMAQALKPGGRLLFTAVREPVIWFDSITNRNRARWAQRYMNHCCAIWDLRLSRDKRTQGRITTTSQRSGIELSPQRSTAPGVSPEL